MLSAAWSQPRVMESVLPSLEYSPACTSSIELQNLSQRSLQIEVEAHRSTGGLVALRGHPAVRVDLQPLERLSFQLAIERKIETGWVKVRERIADGGSPVVALQGKTECVSGDQLLSVIREAAFPTASPWFSGTVAELGESEISLINTTAAAVTATGCYSSGSLFSTPGSGTAGELTPVCSESFHVQVPPFGTRRFPVRREGNSHFSVRTQGRAIVLEMLRPMDAAVRLYKVDSSIQFGSEVPAAPGR